VNVDLLLGLGRVQLDAEEGANLRAQGGRPDLFGDHDVGEPAGGVAFDDELIETIDARGRSEGQGKSHVTSHDEVLETFGQSRADAEIVHHRGRRFGDLREAGVYVVLVGAELGCGE